LSEYGTQVTLNVDCGHRSGVFSADCVRPAPEMADVLLANISRPLSSYSNRAQGMHRAVYTQNKTDVAVFVSESVENKDPRANGPAFSAAKQKELLALLERGTFKVVLLEEIPKHAPVMKGRFVLVIKNRDTDQELYKARYVEQGFLDPLRQRAVQNSPNLRQDISRLVLALASISGFEVWTLDISQAFLQTANENMRGIFLQPPKEMELSSDEFLKLMKPLYGLCDSGDRWHHTLRHRHVEDLQTGPPDADPSLYFRSIGNRLIGLSGVYVDDMLHCGTPDFLRDSKTTSRIFDATPKTMRTAKFAGVNFRQTESGIETDMSDYIEKLTFPSDQSWKHFASFRAKLSWLVYARTDICARVAKLAQITEQHKYFRMLEDCFQQVRKYDMFLNYPALDLDSLYIRGYADASFGMNVDGSSQIGYCILLMDKFPSSTAIFTPFPSWVNGRQRHHQAAGEVGRRGRQQARMDAVSWPAVCFVLEIFIRTELSAAERGNATLYKPVPDCWSLAVASLTSAALRDIIVSTSVVWKRVSEVMRQGRSGRTQSPGKLDACTVPPQGGGSSGKA
jgi:hypothetical protein